MGGSKFLGKQPTTGLDTFEGTKIGVDESNVHGQTGTGSKGNKDTNEMPPTPPNLSIYRRKGGLKFA